MYAMVKHITMWAPASSRGASHRGLGTSAPAMARSSTTVVFVRWRSKPVDEPSPIGAKALVNSIGLARGARRPMASSCQIPEAKRATMKIMGTRVKSATVPVAAPIAMLPPEPMPAGGAARYM